jgi:hypothetical protein
VPSLYSTVLHLPQSVSDFLSWYVPSTVLDEILHSGWFRFWILGAVMTGAARIWAQIKQAESKTKHYLVNAMLMFVVLAVIVAWVVRNRIAPFSTNAAAISSPASGSPRVLPVEKALQFANAFSHLNNLILQTGITRRNQRGWNAGLVYSPCQIYISAAPNNADLRQQLDLTLAGTGCSETNFPTPPPLPAPLSIDETPIATPTPYIATRPFVLIRFATMPKRVDDTDERDLFVAAINDGMDGLVRAFQGMNLEVHTSNNVANEKTIYIDLGTVSPWSK